jgi:predicted PurR-regulated permease PerM
MRREKDMSIQPASTIDWRKRFFIALTILAWLVIAGIVIWAVGYIASTVVLLTIAALLSYIIYPLVKLLHRILPRPLAVLVAFLLMLALLIFILYFVVLVAVEQLVLLINVIQSVIQHPANYSQYQFALDWLSKAGISPTQFNISTQQVLSYVQSAINGIIPLISSVFGMFINGIILASLCVYFMTDGGRIIGWLRHKTPIKQRAQINTLLDMVEKSLGGYIRGQVILAVIITAIISIGALIVGLPYVILLAVIVFVCEFIPIIGAYISGAIAILISLTMGWQTALIMIIFISIVNGVLEGQILAPRILGQSIGLHPIVSITALLIGSQLFGIMGAVLAAPLAGILQAIITASWSAWRAHHPDQFPDELPPSKLEQPSSPPVET